MKTMIRPAVRTRMATVREAFRLHRLARAHRGLWMFYVEHSLLDEARASRLVMTQHLQGACQQWRLALGMAR